MLHIDQFWYSLPPERIAQSPVTPRDHSRLLRLKRDNGEITHHIFADLAELLQPGDLLVRNNTKVVPARLYGTKTTGGKAELLLVKRLSSGSAAERWEALTKPGLKQGQVVHFAGSELTATCVELQGYTRIIEFNLSGSDLFEALNQVGHTPIPPYIGGWSDDDEPELRQLYQTTFAKHQGSAAAPTAGLHFTKTVDAALAARGVEIAEVTLHVGLGTFLRVKTDDITQHRMHSENFVLTAETAEQINQARAAGRRVISVGTTTTRVLESCWDEATGQLVAQSGETKIFIYPPRRFNVVQALITNFHEPRSTLLMLVSAFTTTPNAPHEFVDFAHTPVGQAYEVAKQESYRFLSFGDAMLIE